MHISKLVDNLRKLRKINVFKHKFSHLFDDFLVPQGHFMRIWKCFFIDRVYIAISSTFWEKLNSWSMPKNVFYPLIFNIYLQLLPNYDFWPKKLTKRWLSLSLKTQIFLNFGRLSTSFEICNQKVYSSKNACNSKVNTGLSVQDDQKILKVHYYLGSSRLS